MSALQRPRLLVGGIEEAMDFVENASEPYAIVSLMSRVETQVYGLPVVDPKVCVDHLVIEVRDVPEGWEGAMTVFQAEDIVAFVRGLPPVPTLYINCLVGQSRSAAVAAALSMAWTGDDAVWWQEKCLNDHVHRLVLDAMRRACR